jgi:PAS domain S-box-containing protein
MAAYDENQVNLKRIKVRNRLFLIGIFSGVLAVGASLILRIVRQINKILAARADAEEVLRDSEERLRLVMDNAVSGIITIDERGTIESFNPAAETIFGYAADEAIGKNVKMLMPAPRRAEHDGYIANYLRTGQAKIIGSRREVDGLRKDGTTFPLELGISELVIGGKRILTGIVMDNTERKRAEEALRESEQRFKDVAEAASDWFWEMDENLRFTFFSERRQQLFGVSPENNVGKTRWEVADANPDDDEIWRHHRATLEAHKPFRDFEYAFTTKDGKTKYNKVSGKPVFDANGAFKGYRGAATNVTEQKEAQAQLIQASKLATLGEMASGIAHELNQPLCVVGMAAENSLISMEEGTFDTEFVRKKLRTIVSQRDRMAGIVNHMRLFSRRDITGMELFNPVECVADAVGLVDQQFRTSGIEVKLNLPAACRNVSGHPVQLEQVVLNLLNNARDAILGAMKSAGSGQSHPAPMVRISLVDDKRRKAVVISVADNGGGIPEQALERIFDPFYTTKKEGQGTGLGLSISYSIIDAMGGRLKAQNADGGAEFRISVPAAVDGSGAVDRRSRKKKRKAGTRKRRSGLPRVLVVDDEEVIAEELAEYLQLKGYDVATAGSGLEALELHRSRPADIVITDLLMPEMDGNELIRRLRRTDPDLPVMLVTGHTTFGDEKESVTKGASVVLKKPVELSELLGTLNDLARF